MIQCFVLKVNLTETQFLLLINLHMNRVPAYSEPFSLELAWFGLFLFDVATKSPICCHIDFLPETSAGRREWLKL
jgi:hypothetical protein